MSLKFSPQRFCKVNFCSAACVVKALMARQGPSFQAAPVHHLIQLGHRRTRGKAHFFKAEVKSYFQAPAIVRRCCFTYPVWNFPLALVWNWILMVKVRGSQGAQSAASSSQLAPRPLARVLEHVVQRLKQHVLFTTVVQNCQLSPGTAAKRETKNCQG